MKDPNHWPQIGLLVCGGCQLKELGHLVQGKLDSFGLAEGAVPLRRAERLCLAKSQSHSITEVLV